MSEPEDTASATQRLDKWLWCARFFRSRTLATRFSASGRLRINTQLVAKAHHPVRVGDVLTFPLGALVRVIRVEALARHRGPATEARELYEDLDPPRPRREPGSGPPATRPTGAGRPTKAARRATDRLRGREDRF